MLGFSGVALIAAAAVALGGFGNGGERGGSRHGVERVPEAATSVVAGAISTAPRLVLTYYLVDSPEEQSLLYSTEDEMWNREYLQTSKIEVLLARDQTEEAAAFAEVAAAKLRSTTTTVLVEDLRAK